MDKKLLYTPPNWLLSGRTLTFIALIALPFLFVAIELLTLRLLLPYGLSCPPIPYPSNLIYISNVVLPDFQYFLYILILALYPPYPFPFSRHIEDYFERRGYKTAVMEYELVKKILYVAVPLLIITMIIIYIHDLDYKCCIKKNVKIHDKICPQWTRIGGLLGWMPKPVHIMTEIVEVHYDGFYFLKLFLFLIVIAASLKVIFAVSRARFRLYFAKGCFNFIEDRKDEVEKMRYFVMGLNSYNSYLRRQIKLEISDLKKIYSRIASSPTSAKDEVINRVCKVFQKDMFEFEDYTLEPVRSLYKFLNIPDSQIFLTEEPLVNKLKNYGAFAVVAIPVLLNVLKAIGITK
jgi:hypothetical protein